MRRSPDDWPDVATLIDNNYRNMHGRDVKTKGREAADEESVPFLGATLPTVLVQFLDAHIVSVCRLTSWRSTPRAWPIASPYWPTTPEMQKEAGSIG